MRKIALLSALLYVSVCAVAQIDTTDEKNLDEVVVFSNKFAEKKKIWRKKLMCLRLILLPGITARTPVTC